MKAPVVIMLLASPAAAERWELLGEQVQGGGYLHYEMSGLHAVDDDARMAERENEDVVLGGIRFGAFIGKGATIGYHVGLDLLAGSTLDRRGFAYDVAFMPLGIAARFGKTGVIAIGTGIGANGAVNTLDDAAIVPIQTTIELGRGIRLLGRARVSYVLGAANRQSAAPSVPFADELDAMLGIRLGRSYDKYGFPSGNGYFVAFGYREQLGTQFMGLTLGYSLDGALPRRFVEDEIRQREQQRERRRKRIKEQRERQRAH